MQFFLWPALFATSCFVITLVVHWLSDLIKKQYIGKQYPATKLDCSLCHGAGTVDHWDYYANEHEDCPSCGGKGFSYEVRPLPVLLLRMLAVLFIVCGIPAAIVALFMLGVWILH